MPETLLGRVIEMMPADDQCVVDIFDALLLELSEAKPNDHTAKDRAYAIAIAEAQKARAFFVVHVGMLETLTHDQALALATD